MGGTGGHVGRRPDDGLLLNDAAERGAGGILSAARAAGTVATETLGASYLPRIDATRLTVIARITEPKR